MTTFEPTTTTEPTSDEWKAAQARAKALGLRLSCGVDNVYRLFRKGERQPHNERDSWASLLELLDASEAGQLIALAERAEACGAHVLARWGNAYVELIPPRGYQQHKLECTARDLAMLVAAWEGQAKG